MTDTPTTKAAAIISHYGTKHQLDQLQEECAELIVAASKAKRVGGYLHSNFIEELADVKIMLMQFETVLDAARMQEYELQINYKLNRQLDRIRNGDK